jgi:hypothetical protein
MTFRKAHRTALLLAASTCATGCGWTNLDAVGTVLAANDTGPPDVSVDVPPVDASRSKDASDGSPEDTRQNREASTLPCTTAEPLVEEWTFDADAGVSGWSISAQSGVQATLTWTSAVGDPSPGALQVEVTPRSSDGGATSGAWPQYNTPLGNLSGRTISAWVWLDSGPSPDLKLFVQTGTQWVWADNGTVQLSPKAWTCVSIPVSSPSYSGENYDPTEVVRIGFQLFGADPFRVYVGTVRIY